MGDSPVKKDVELSLKYGALVPGHGLQRVVAGSVEATGRGRFQLKVVRFAKGGKWKKLVRPATLWIEDNVVTSRTYVIPEAEQIALTL